MRAHRLLMLLALASLTLACGNGESTSKEVIVFVSQAALCKGAVLLVCCRCVASVLPARRRAIEL